MVAGLQVRGGHPVTISSVDADDESAAIQGQVSVDCRLVDVIWRANGEARWLGSDFDLEAEWAELIFEAARRMRADAG